MTTCDSETLQYRRLRTPRDHGDVLIEPPLGQFAPRLEENVREREASGFCFFGRSLNQWSLQARRELLQRAVDYTGLYRTVPMDASALDVRRPILLAGHQPQLYHSGVWFKNLALSQLGRLLEAHALNLVIDNDLFRSNSIAVPTQNGTGPWVEQVSLDRPVAGSTGQVPFEARTIQDLEFFGAFGERVLEVIHPALRDPIVRPLWAKVRESARRTGNLGLAIAQGRHALEGEQGWQTLEIPLSLAVESEVFRAFVCYLSQRVESLFQVYNDVRQQYRRIHRIRSQAHPVPALGRRGEWFELPLWVWDAEQPRRRPLYAKPALRATRLWDGQHRELELPFHGDAYPEAAVEQLEQWSQQGVCIRPRALMTTLYARLFLGDLFLHGIGGAKYDQLTDSIMSRWLAVDPPAFAVLSATVKLPLDHSAVTPQDVQNVTTLLRELRFHPEKYVAGQDVAGQGADKQGPEEAVVSDLVRKKAEWIHQPPRTATAKQRHEAIEAVNRQLQRHVESQRKILLDEREQLRHQLRKASRLGWREFPFCLFSETTLPNFLLELWKKEL